MLFEIIRSGASIPEIIIEVTMLIMVLSFTFSSHEFMHAWVAERMGDDTPRRQGRITLNPLAHIDPFGTIMLLLAGFGWAKPVQYNPNNLKKYNRWTCERLISLAGVTANYVTAILGTILLVILEVVFIKNPATSDKGLLFQRLVFTFFFYLTEYGFLFMAFNLIPIPPLDGYRFISTFVPYKWRRKFDEFSQYSYYVFFALLLMGRFGNIDILSRLVRLIETPFRWPIDKLADWLFGVLI